MKITNVLGHKCEVMTRGRFLEIEVDSINLLDESGKIRKDIPIDYDYLEAIGENYIIIKGFDSKEKVSFFGEKLAEFNGEVWTIIKNRTIYLSERKWYKRKENGNFLDAGSTDYYYIKLNADFEQYKNFIEKNDVLFVQYYNYKWRISPSSQEKVYYKIFVEDRNTKKIYKFIFWLENDYRDGWASGHSSICGRLSESNQWSRLLRICLEKCILYCDVFGTFMLNCCVNDYQYSKKEIKNIINLGSNAYKNIIDKIELLRSKLPEEFADPQQILKEIIEEEEKKKKIKKDFFNKVLIKAKQYFSEKQIKYILDELNVTCLKYITELQVTEYYRKDQIKNKMFYALKYDAWSHYNNIEKKYFPNFAENTDGEFINWICFKECIITWYKLDSIN